MAYNLPLKEIRLSQPRQRNPLSRTPVFPRGTMGNKYTDRQTDTHTHTHTHIYIYIYIIIYIYIYRKREGGMFYNSCTRLTDGC